TVKDETWVQITGKAITVHVKLTGLTGKCGTSEGAFPSINLSIMGLGCVPPLPDTLSATASVRVS
ncbi:MAG: hypothetical protein L0H29_11140, partial [Sinobacteraceae bacterium]|nr:hypothetical protein [Nevskiaceae bacterium]